MATNPRTGGTITPPRVPVIDARTGEIDRAWFQFLYALFNDAASLTALVSAIAQMPQPQQVPDTGDDVTPGVSGMLEEIAEIRGMLSTLAQAPPVVPDVRSALLPVSTITVGSSPFTHQNSTGDLVDILTTGGGGVTIEFGRDGVNWYQVDAGMVALSPGDRIRVTYATAPTMTMIPR